MKKEGSRTSGTNKDAPQLSLEGERRHVEKARTSRVRRQSESLGWSRRTTPPASASTKTAVSHRQQISPSDNRETTSIDNHRRASAPPIVPPSLSLPSCTAFGGSFDDSRYWDYAFRHTNKGDMGHHCRECKRPFSSLNEDIAVRRGGRIELRYHKTCFSMIADPRSQPSSSANVGKFVQSLKGTVAPEELYRKMRTRGHW